MLPILQIKRGIKVKKILSIAIVASLTLASTLFSQGDVATDEIQKIKVKAKKEVLDPTMTSLATTIITEDEIKATGANNVAEVLQYTSGLVVRGSAGPQVAQFRGASQNHTLVLVNGRKQAAAQNLFHDLAQYNVQNIERIEIIKGAAATRYGANAVGGVINIITKDRVDRLSGIEGGIRYGSYNSVTANILGNLSYGSQNRGSVFISGSFTTNARNYQIDDTTSLGNINQKVPNNEILSGDVRIGNSYRFNDEGDILHASFGFLYEDRNAPGDYVNSYDKPPSLGFPVGTGFNYKTQKYSGDISYEHYSLDLFDFFIDASTLYQTVENSGDRAYTHNSSENFTTEANFIIERSDSWGNTFTFDNNVELGYVNDYFIAGATTFGFPSVEDGMTVNRNTISIAYLPTLKFLNYENTDVARITIIPTVRFDTVIGTSDYEDENRDFYEPTYSLGLMYTFDDERKYILKGNVATSYRLPSFNDLFVYSSSNPNIKKEESISGDIGFIVTPISMLRLEATYYVSSIDNLIAYVYDPNGTSMVQNVDKAMLQGVDASIFIYIPITPIFSDIEVSANYAYQFEANGTYAGEGDFRLPFAPEHSASAMFSYIYNGNNDIFSGRLNFLVNYSGKVFTGFQEANPIEDYTTFDITASATFIEYITIEGGVRNILNERYDSGFNFQAPGREWFIALSGRI